MAAEAGGNRAKLEAVSKEVTDLKTHATIFNFVETLVTSGGGHCSGLEGIASPPQMQPSLPNMAHPKDLIIWAQMAF